LENGFLSIIPLIVTILYTTGLSIGNPAAWLTKGPASTANKRKIVGIVVFHSSESVISS